MLAALSAVRGPQRTQAVPHWKARRHKAGLARSRWVLLTILGVVASMPAQATDPVGMNLLRSWYPHLDGSGLSVLQAEAGGDVWQVNPSVVGLSESNFTWHSSSGETNRFPNQLGAESGHANQVGSIFYGQDFGLAPGIAMVENYEALHFYAKVQSSTPVAADVVNQSFAFAGEIPTVDKDYDDYAATRGTLFVSGAGNQGSPASPSTAYNGICVAAFNGMSSAGPTLQGRCKPDLTAPAGQTSFSTPLVAGAAVLLRQASLEGLGGANVTQQASDYRTIKALLLNGADKPAGWTNGTQTPLDARHGAGILNVFESMRTLHAGRQSPTGEGSYHLIGSHVPPLNEPPLSVWRGWNLSSLTSSITQHGEHHYTLELFPETLGGATFTATVVWEKLANQTSINDLDLFLYRADTGALVASSESTKDNVEHLAVVPPGAGRYVLQVLKRGGAQLQITPNQTYALAFSFGPEREIMITGAQWLNGSFAGFLQGEPFATYVVEFSENFQEWQWAATLSLPGSGSASFQDAEGSQTPYRIYRARLSP